MSSISSITFLCSGKVIYFSISRGEKLGYYKSSSIFDGLNYSVDFKVIILSITFYSNIVVSNKS